MSNMFDDFAEHQEEKAASISVEDLDALVQKLADERGVKEDLAFQQKRQQEKIDDLEKQIQGYLEEMGRTNYSAPAGRVNVETRHSYPLPQGEAKKAFFAYLKAKGEDAFENAVHMNSRTLQKFVRDECEANEDVPGFFVPGCENKTGTTKVKFTRSKP